MSAESPHKSCNRGGHVVAPQPVSDRSIIESVAGFINEVVPQAYTSLPPGEIKEAITWARFEYGDINDPALYPDTAEDRSSAAPLLLVLGYGSGVQVWAIPASGEATEVLSWRQGVVRTLRVLPTPLADSPVSDAFSHKRPLVAMCDSAGPGPQFCSLSFISLRCGDQVKSIKFKNPVSDVLANRRSVVVTFPERIAVFDACTLEDRLTVTTCYPCQGPNPNPVTLGTRWLAYAERQLLHTKRSSGGSEGEGVQSYTATVLHAAKSLGKGLRELGETVASSLTGGSGATGVQRAPLNPVGLPGSTTLNPGNDIVTPGVVTILDVQGISTVRGDDSRSGNSTPISNNTELMVAHFTAHSEPIVALQFDPSGILLLTADKRGHDFHLFRIQPHPSGSTLTAVHHLYVLHRGDTTAKVQDIAFAADSRWVAVSTLRGTTHVFPITPYGGPVGIRTHTTPHVVNRLSRFHRSAGLTADGRNSPVPTGGSTTSVPINDATMLPVAMPYPNPRLPPYPHPTVVNPLAQIRQPISHILSGMAPMSPTVFSHQTYHRNPSARMIGRSQSVSDETSSGCGVPLRVSACFAAPRAWLVSSPTVSRESSSKIHKRSVDSLFVMACHGSLIQYDLEPKHVAGIPKEKVCDDTAIELEVKAKAQWVLLRPPHSSELQPPLPASNPLMVLPDHLPPASESRPEDIDERWLSQVEIVTHAGPHRRLWMGPQFIFKTYTNSTVGAPLSLLEMEAVEIGTAVGSRPARSNPVNMPLSGRPVVPVLIESGSASSYEQSPRLIEAYGGDGDSDGSAGPGDTQLREDLADAMMESPGVPLRDAGRRSVISMHNKKSAFPIEKVVNPVGTVITVAVPSDEEMGGPPSPAAARSKGCERVLPADIGKVDVNVVRRPSSAPNVESNSVNLIEQKSKQVPEKKDEAQTHCSNESISHQRSDFNLDSKFALSLENKVVFGSGINSLNSIMSCEQSTKGNHMVGKGNRSHRQQSENATGNEISTVIDSEVLFSGKCKRKVPNEGNEKNQEVHFSSKKSEFHRVKESNTFSDGLKLEDKFTQMNVLPNAIDLQELNFQGPEESKNNDSVLECLKNGVSKKYKRGHGKKKNVDHICKDTEDSLSSDYSKRCDIAHSDGEESIVSKKTDKSRKKKSENVLEENHKLLGCIKSVIKSEIYDEQQWPDFSYDVVEAKIESDVPVEIDNVSESSTEQKTKCPSSSAQDDELSDCFLECEESGIPITTPNIKDTTFKNEKPATSFCENQKAVTCAVPSNVDSNFPQSFTHSNIQSGSSEELQKAACTKISLVEDHAQIIDCGFPVVSSGSKLKECTSNVIDVIPSRSWSSVLASSPKDTTNSPNYSKAEKEANTLQGDVNSDELTSVFSGILKHLDLIESDSELVVTDKHTSETDNVASTFLRANSKNNNNNKQAENFCQSTEEKVLSTAPPTWSSIVSLSKPGTSSSTDEGSGGYDSNESKDSTDLVLHELDDSVNKSEKSKIFKVNKLSENVENAFEDEEAEISKTNDDIPSDQAVPLAPNLKKNRRTKKKRR